VSGPQDPDPDSSRDSASDASAEDAAWRAIVANFGDRAELDEHNDAVDRRDQVPGSPRGLVQPTELVPEPEDHYVPPPPPPVPQAEPARMIAWVGLFGVPLAVLVAVLAGLPVASWLGLILMVWFVGGFVYLVASMRPGPRDDNDDGAVL
jgi:hypothetical protein